MRAGFPACTVISSLIHLYYRIAGSRITPTFMPRQSGRAVPRILVVTVAFAVFAGEAQAQTGRDSSAAQPGLADVFLHDGRSAVGLAVRAYSAPFRWNGSDWLTAGGYIAATGLSALADVEVRDAMARSHSSSADRAVDIAVAYGDGLNAVILVGGLYGVGLVIREPWLRESMMLAGTAFLVSASISTVTKFVVGRARPYNELGNHSFKPFSFSEDFVSFPSGHTVVAFSISSVLAERIGNPWATVALYGLATATAVGRIYQDQHWLSDVVPAALFASTVGRSIARWYEGEQGEPSLGVLPGPGTVTVVWRF